MEKTKILVTGGCGFIGSNFIRHIIQKYPSYAITNLDKLTYAGNKENLKDIESNSNYTFVKGDICDDKLLDELTKKNDIIVNFAAESHVDNSINAPLIFTKTNVLGTHTLLESARRNKIKRFIHISTDEVYGTVPKGSSVESDNLEPNSPYASSKAASDLLARSYFETYGFPVIVTRSSNNYGPYQYPEKLIPLFVTNLIEAKKVPLYGDGLNVRDWLFVTDNCEAIDFIMHTGKAGEVYNIGGDNTIPNIEITKTVLSYMGKDDSSIQYVKDRLGHDRRYSLDCSKLKKLGWKQKHNFDQAIKETIDWYKNNEKWWKPLKK
jgi:dTDP-glucose 4,6-dehydratase